MALDVVAQSRCFGGTQFTYQHQSFETGTPMRFAAFVPPLADKQPVPVVWYLSGLTCTEENFTVKAGAQRIAAELGLLLVAPDTSPRLIEDASFSAFTAASSRTLRKSGVPT